MDAGLAALLGVIAGGFIGIIGAYFGNKWEAKREEEAEKRAKHAELQRLLGQETVLSGSEIKELNKSLKGFGYNIEDPENVPIDAAIGVIQEIINKYNED